MRFLSGGVRWGPARCDPAPGAGRSALGLRMISPPRSVRQPESAPSHNMYLSILFNMPSYDFVCQECGASFEVRLSISAYSEGEGRVCTKCGGTKVERAFTAVNIIAGGSSGSTGNWSGGGCGSSGFT